MLNPVAELSENFVRNILWILGDEINSDPL